MNKTIMKKAAVAVMLAVSTLFAPEAQAQKEDKTFSFGFGLEGGIPLGDKGIKELFNGYGGVTIRGSYKVGPGFVTLTTGVLAFLPKDIEDEDLKVGVQIPIKAGYKFIFLDKLFVQGEVGYSRFSVGFADENDEVQTQSTGGFTVAPTIGANFGVFEVGVRYENLVGLKFKDGDKFSVSNIGLRVGFNF